MGMRPNRTIVQITALAAAFLAWPLATVTGAAGERSPGVPDGARAATGRIEGQVVLGPRLTARRMRFLAYPDAQPAVAKQQGKPAGGPAGEYANVVVYLEAAPGLRGDRRAAAGAPAIRQEGLAFVPHVLPVLKGSIVEFPNSDPVFHNVFSLSRAASFDLGRYPRGGSKSVRFDAPGVVKVFCHIHSDMSAVVLVLDNPYFAVPDAAGVFRIDGIPPGEYRAVAWHERARPVSLALRVSAGAATPATFAIPLEGPVE